MEKGNILFRRAEDSKNLSYKGQEKVKFASKALKTVIYRPVSSFPLLSTFREVFLQNSVGTKLKFLAFMVSTGS